MTGALHPGTRTLLRDALGRLDAAAALPFAEAVVHQVAHPLGARVAAGAPEQRAARERAVAAVLLATIGAAASRDERLLEQAADQLAADAALLAACYQNLDLLPAFGHAASDAVALLVGRAVERLAARPTP